MNEPTLTIDARDLQLIDATLAQAVEGILAATPICESAAYSFAISTGAARLRLLDGPLTVRFLRALADCAEAASMGLPDAQAEAHGRLQDAINGLAEKEQALVHTTTVRPS
ncbi:hypothetical protein [uncultured Tateyamaria sp.]|uniref:hypothetical protein n=1 Tax=uncultured Tateyamaria sp. TaxID=455651 RepID=UPI00260BCD62|nr:hypothetical protein [uncultured Tateyamaria sp.]